MSAKMRMIVAIGLFALVSFSVALAGETIPIKNAFGAGEIKLIFEGVGDDGKSLKVYIVNTGSTPLKISVPDGKTIFEFNGQAIKTISFIMFSELALEVAPQKIVSFSVQQTGKQRISSGKLTATKTEDGTKLEFDNFVVGGASR